MDKFLCGSERWPSSWPEPPSCSALTPRPPAPRQGLTKRRQGLPEWQQALPNRRMVMSARQIVMTDRRQGLSADREVFPELPESHAEPATTPGAPTRDSTLLLSQVPVNARVGGLLAFSLFVCLAATLLDCPDPLGGPGGGSGGAVDSGAASVRGVIDRRERLFPSVRRGEGRPPAEAFLIGRAGASSTAVVCRHRKPRRS
jgi:hypothetical protein